MFTRNCLKLLVCFSFSSCSGGEVVHDYPVDMQKQIAKNQAKYQTLETGFDFDKTVESKKSDNGNDLCKKLEFYFINSFDGKFSKKIAEKSCSFSSDYSGKRYAVFIDNDQNLNCSVFNKSGIRINKDQKLTDEFCKNIDENLK